MNSPTSPAIIPTIPSMKNIAPFVAGRRFGSFPPMHASHARAAHGSAASAITSPRAAN
jgi:hypothetical protein